MSLTDWHESEQRRLIGEYVATQLCAAEWERRRTRRRARVRRCLHWLDPTKQVVSDVGRPR